jgi:hypothetical protein
MGEAVPALGRLHELELEVDEAREIEVFSRI